jgi:hypothetical protein
VQPSKEQLEAAEEHRRQSLRASWETNESVGRPGSAGADSCTTLNMAYDAPLIRVRRFVGALEFAKIYINQSKKCKSKIIFHYLIFRWFSTKNDRE